jgi:hypothetical protein
MFAFVIGGKMRKIMMLFLFAVLHVFMTRYAAAVTIYQHPNFTGASQRFGPGRYDAGSIAIGVNQMSSLEVEPGYVALCYPSTGFKGPPREYSTSVAYTSDFDDKLCSLIVMEEHKPSTPVTIYSSPNFKGLRQSYGVGRFNQNHIVKVIGNDNTRSVRVSPGFTVILGEKYDFGGLQLKFTKDTPDIGNAGDGISCVEVIKTGPPDHLIALCEEPNFQGNVKYIDCKEGVYKAETLGLKQVSSMVIPDGYVLIIRDDNADDDDFKISFKAKGKATRVPSITPIPVTPRLLVIISKDE